MVSHNCSLGDYTGQSKDLSTTIVLPQYVWDMLEASNVLGTDIKPRNMKKPASKKATSKSKSKCEGLKKEVVSVKEQLKMLQQEERRENIRSTIEKKMNVIQNNKETLDKNIDGLIKYINKYQMELDMEIEAIKEKSTKEIEEIKKTIKELELQHDEKIFEIEKSDRIMKQYLVASYCEMEKNIKEAEQIEAERKMEFNTIIETMERYEAETKNEIDISINNIKQEIEQHKRSATNTNLRKTAQKEAERKIIQKELANPRWNRLFKPYNIQSWKGKTAVIKQESSTYD